MSKKATAQVIVSVAMAATLGAQTPAEWRHIGNAAIELGLAGVASGPVERVWYSPDGTSILVRTASGKVFETSDLDTWKAALAGTSIPAAADAGGLKGTPENGAILRNATSGSARAYGLGRYAYRSDDGGASWDNLTAFRNGSILGTDLRDLAVSPKNEDEIVVAGGTGVFRSVDGGKSWSGLNQGLPNLPAVRIRSLPVADRGTRLELSNASVVEWQPGEKLAWHPGENTEAMTDLVLRQALGQLAGGRVTAVAIGGDFIYTGMADGRLRVSADGGRGAWKEFLVEGGGITAFWVDPGDPRVALAALDLRQSPGGRSVRVLRTINGGTFWDDLSSDLPETAVRGVTADRASGAIYVATDRGVFFTRTDLGALAPPAPWKAVPGLPDARVMDVRLDAAGTQLWAAVDGYGMYATLAPHRAGDPRVVSAADFVARAVAPGALISVAGAKVDSAQAGNLAVPVLAAGDAESQLQIPFEARGDTLSLSINASGARRVLSPLALGATAPAIFIDRDGAPLLLDADSGVLLDAMHPAHSRARIQVLATGLGKVTPDWPTGLAAPLENPPQVAASVRAWLDRSPVEVTRAVLAPGYIGFYLIEIEIPKIVNYGPAELYIEADGQPSNRVRVYIEP